MLKPYFETKLGKLYCGNCLEIMKEIPDRSIDFFFTDPPYNINKEGYKDNLNEQEYQIFSKTWFNQAEKLSDLIIFTSGLGKEMKNLKLWFDIKFPTWIIIWMKPNSVSFSPWGGFQLWEPLLIYGKPKKKIKKDAYFLPITVQKDIADLNGIKRHSTPKQITLWEKIINDFTEPNDLILDCFLGSGTTAVACEKLNRRWIGIELDPKFCELSKIRIKNESQQQKLFF